MTLAALAGRCPGATGWRGQVPVAKVASVTAEGGWKGGKGQKTSRHAMSIEANCRAELRLQNLREKARIENERKEREKAMEPERKRKAEAKAAKARRRIEWQLFEQAQEEDKAQKRAERAERKQRRKQHRAELQIPVLRLQYPQKRDLAMTSSANIASPSASAPNGKIVLKIRAPDDSGVRFLPDDVVPVLCLSAWRNRTWPTIGIAKLQHHRVGFKMKGVHAYSLEHRGTGCIGKKRLLAWV